MLRPCAGRRSEPTYISIGDPYAGTEGSSAPRMIVHQAAGQQAQGLPGPHVPPGADQDTVPPTLNSLDTWRSHTPVSSTGKSSSGKSDKLARYSGKQFSYAPPKKGQYASDAYFTEFQRLYEVTLPPPSRCARHSSRLYPREGIRTPVPRSTVVVHCAVSGGWRAAHNGQLAPSSTHRAEGPCAGLAVNHAASQGERYENPGATETKSRLESVRGKIGPDWRPSSPSKKRCGGPR